MANDPYPELVHGWETLLVAAMSGGQTTRGLVHLNKTLARLQRHGFPIPIEFENLPMGPASLDVKTRAQAAADEGLLEPRSRPMPGDYEDREDWKLTEEGLRYVEDEVGACFEDREGGGLELEIFQEEIRELRHKTGKTLTRESHKELCLDDPEEFRERYENAIRGLEDWNEYFTRDRTPRTNAELAAAAAVDLALTGLQDERDRAIDLFQTDSTGIRNVFWNAERLLTILGGLEEGQALNRDVWDQEENELERILTALEFNCDLYSLVEIPSQEEIEEEFWEAEPFDPERTT